MEHCPRKVDKTPLDKEVAKNLKELFLAKGYPEYSLKTFVPFTFTFNDTTFNLILPLIVELKERYILLCHYKSSTRGLLSFEREALALARLCSSPPPKYALLTNLQMFVLIDVRSGKHEIGGVEKIPDYNPNVLLAQPFDDAFFDPNIEKRLLYLYLSGG
jgi:hypothetical protein